jgi:alpha-galactosidase
VNRSTQIAIVSVLVVAALAAPVAAAGVPDPLPDPGGTPPPTDKPAKVYILMGQSNMVGMGDISGGSSRWGEAFLDPVVSVYPGTYSPTADYDRMRPITTMKLEKFGGVRPTPYPGGGTHVVRGHIRMKTTGVYRFKPGYRASTHNLMAVDGKEVHRREVGGDREFTPIKLAAGKKVPFTITYLTDAANGLGWVQRLDIPGTLETLVKTEGKFPHLVDEEGHWTVRRDVIYKGVVTARGKGPLTVGLQGNTIGPELQFGHIMGTYHDEPVILIKSSQGNRSLGWDFLPPGSERFEYDGRIYAGYKDSPASWEKGTKPEPINWYAGKQYDDCVAAVHEVLDDFASEFPQYKDQGYEIAGFVWWQGHKDGGSAAHANRYEQNLVRLIKTLRKEFKAPDAPLVIATIGFNGWKMSGHQVTVANAQLAVSGDTGNYPEFKGNVLTVETRDFWRDVSVSPKNQGYHYNRNAETYMLVGDALGRAMVKLLGE